MPSPTGCRCRRRSASLRPCSRSSALLLGAPRTAVSRDFSRYGRRRRRRAPVAALLVVSLALELRAIAPAVHPPRLDPYRPPSYVDFLRAAPRARVLGADGLMTPLTSAAVGLRDLRAIDVLTPGA